MSLRKIIQLIKNFDVTEYHNAVYVYRQEQILESIENKNLYILFVKPKPTIIQLFSTGLIPKFQNSTRILS